MQCDTCDTACPMNPESEWSGSCLPTAIDLMTLKLSYGVTWACHSDFSKPCRGVIQELAFIGENTKVNGRMYNLDDWNDNSFKPFRDFENQKKIAYAKWQDLKRQSYLTGNKRNSETK